MSPFPPTYTEHVSRRDVLQPAQAGMPTLRDIALRVAGAHFSTHILPTPEVLEQLQGATKRPPRAPRKRRREDDDYTPDEDVEERPAPRRTTGLNYTQALWWSDMNRDLLKHLPPALVNDLFDAVCLYSPMSLTKDVLATYFLPHVAPEKARGTAGAEVPPLPLDARVRLRIFFPASLPLFSQDPKTAALLLSVLAGALALSPSAARLTAPIESLDLHGLTRLQNASLVRLIRAPPSVPNALPTPWHLRRVTLPGCVAIGDAAVTALVRASGATLEHVDLAMTSVSTASVREIGAACARLRVLRVAWCENFTESTFSEAVSTCVAECAHATPARIPFQRLEEVDVAHTSVGDVAIGGLLRLCGTQLRALDVGYTGVGEGGSLDMLCLGLGLAGDGTPGATRLEHIGLAGLCLHSASLVSLLTRLLLPGGALCSVDVDDCVEYARRQQTNLPGRQGVTGATLHTLVAHVADAAHRRGVPFRRFSARGDKRRAAVPGHWALRGAPSATLGTTLFRLLTRCEVRGWLTQYVALNGLQLDAYDLTEPHEGPSRVRTLHLAGTGLRDDALDALAPWTGALEALYLDDTQITRTCRAHAAEALDRLVDRNPRLALVSLSQCRGIPVRERRGFFAAYRQRGE